MKGSIEIIRELGDVLKSKGNLPVGSIHVCNYGTWDEDIDCDCLDKFLGELFNASLSKTIIGVFVVYWVPRSHCGLTVWIENSNDGRTNIDAAVVEAFSKLKWREN